MLITIEKRTEKLDSIFFFRMNDRIAEYKLFENESMTVRNKRPFFSNNSINNLRISLNFVL